jgi:hypothetical protein
MQGDANISVLDLDALREAFRASAREHHISDSEWSAYAELFLKQAWSWERRQKLAGAAPRLTFRDAD